MWKLCKWDIVVEKLAGYQNRLNLLNKDPKLKANTSVNLAITKPTHTKPSTKPIPRIVSFVQHYFYYAALIFYSHSSHIHSKHIFTHELNIRIQNENFKKIN